MTALKLAYAYFQALRFWSCKVGARSSAGQAPVGSTETRRPPVLVCVRRHAPRADRWLGDLHSPRRVPRRGGIKYGTVQDRDISRHTDTQRHTTMKMVRIRAFTFISWWKRKNVCSLNSNKNAMGDIIMPKSFMLSFSIKSSLNVWIIYAQLLFAHCFEVKRFSVLFLPA